MSKPKYIDKPTDSLIPYINNARTHSPEQVAQIAASIKEFGLLNPILVDKENTVIAGHGRLLAAQKLGLATVPCVQVEHLTEAQRKAYIIADNKLALNAGWDEELLRLELAELDNLDFDIALTGFNQDELNFLQGDWASEVDESKGVASLDSITESLLKVSVAERDREQAKELISNALDQAGVAFDFR